MSGPNPGFSSNKPTHYLRDHGDNMILKFIDEDKKDNFLLEN